MGVGVTRAGDCGPLKNRQNQTIKPPDTASNTPWRAWRHGGGYDICLYTGEHINCGVFNAFFFFSPNSCAVGVLAVLLDAGVASSPPARLVPTQSCCYLSHLSYGTLKKCLVKLSNFGKESNSIALQRRPPPSKTLVIRLFLEEIFQIP